MERTLTYGMVGGGAGSLIGPVHRAAAAFDPHIRLAAGCFSADAARNAASGEAYGVARVYADCREMAAAEAARPDGVDFAVILTPNYLHFENAMAFLQAGIPVICEKPLCVSLEQASALAAAVRARGLLFAVAYGYTGYSMVRAMRAMVREGMLGEIIAVNAEYLSGGDAPSVGRPEAARRGWRGDPARAGATHCIGDIGTHMEHLARTVTGLGIRRLCATADHFGHALELNANFLLELENGAHGAYWCSKVAAGRHNDLRLRVYGTRGALEWAQITPETARYTPVGEATRILTRGGGTPELDAALDRVPAGHPEGLHVAFANIYRAFAHALRRQRAGEPLAPEELGFPTIEDGAEGVRFIDAACRSIQRGSVWVEL